MTAPVLSGSITADGAIPILQAVEARRTTGVLRYKAQGKEGDVLLVRGQIAPEQVDSAGGGDPVEVLLGLREGSFEVYQRLPPLAGARGDDQRRTGALEVHDPAALMRYARGAGLTGRVAIQRGAEALELVYDAGTLRALALDGDGESALREALAWSDGTFEVQAFAAPAPATLEALLVPPGTKVDGVVDTTHAKIPLRGGEGVLIPYRIDDVRRDLFAEGATADDDPRPVAAIFFGSVARQEAIRSEPSALGGGRSPHALSAVPPPARTAARALMEGAAWTVFTFTIFLAVLALLARVPFLR